METLTVDGSVSVGTFVSAVALTVAPGEVVAVLGPNGAGKTTLLRTIAGLQRLSSGTVTIAGRVVDEPDRRVWVTPADRGVGVVFQDYRLFPRMSVRDNVAFTRRIRGETKRASRAGVEPILARLDLLGLADRRPSQLSGGQAQRVALARALAHEPAALLLDEPTAALDARSRIEIRESLRRHLAQFEGPVLVVTHDALEALVLADRLVVLEEGRVVQDGTPAEVAARPATEYVAHLVGLNYYRGIYDPVTSSVALDGGGSLVVTAHDGLTRGPAVVALRPAAVTLHTEKPLHASPRNVWPGEVRSLQLLGDRVRIAVEATPAALVDVTPGAVADLALVPGLPVWLSAKATETHAYR